MGATASKEEEVTVLLGGLESPDNHKETILYKLKLGLDENVGTVLSPGFNIETVKYKNVTFKVVDIGKDTASKSLWRPFAQDLKGLIFVVDSNDRESIGEAREEMNRMLQEDEVRDAAVLIYTVNNQDSPNTMNAAEITNKLALHSIRNPNWYIQTCTISGDGLYAGLDWLIGQLSA